MKGLKILVAKGAANLFTHIALSNAASASNGMHHQPELPKSLKK